MDVDVTAKSGVWFTPKRSAVWLDDDLAELATAGMPPFKQRRLYPEDGDDSQFGETQGWDETATSDSDTAAMLSGQETLERIKMWERRWLSSATYAHVASLRSAEEDDESRQTQPSQILVCIAQLLAEWKTRCSWETCFDTIREHICLAAFAMLTGFVEDDHLPTKDLDTINKLLRKVLDAHEALVMYRWCGILYDAVSSNDAVKDVLIRNENCRFAFNFLNTLDYFLLLGMDVFGVTQ